MTRRIANWVWWARNGRRVAMDMRNALATVEVGASLLANRAASHAWRSSWQMAKEHMAAIYSEAVELGRYAAKEQQTWPEGR